MTRVRIDMFASLDGYASTTGTSPDNPMGEDWGRLTAAYAAPVHHCAGAKRRRTMKPSKQIPTRLKIDVLIIIVGLGVIALGIVTTTARILGTPVLEYARLIPF